MRNIRISEEVWQAIASRGKFGESEDDVLIRVFGLPPNSPDEGVNSSNKSSISSHRTPIGHRRVLSARRMSSYLGGGQMHIEFQGGNVSSWPLPGHSDKAGLRELVDKAILFARNNGASHGQVLAVRKTLTSEGYWLTK